MAIWKLDCPVFQTVTVLLIFIIRPFCRCFANNGPTFFSYFYLTIIILVLDSPNSSQIFGELTTGKNEVGGTSVSVNSESNNSYFDTWSRGKCLYVCSVCLWESRNVNQFWKHSMGSHQLSIADYKSQHGDPCIEKTTTECKSCFKILRHDPGSLENHVSKLHQLTLREYFDSFIAVKKKSNTTGKMWIINRSELRQCCCS
jgi:hypothetical protein